MNSAIGQSTGRAKTGVWRRKATGLAGLFGLTGLNSQVGFRTAIAHRRAPSNPAGARLA
ncbi:hypothetical protein PDR5_55760 [Pseudomonas sp. DR 5-09]|nr:hypothetical protein PDR5_55760 [Pseudomonas sp. DR 5-09]